MAVRNLKYILQFYMNNIIDINIKLFNKDAHTNDILDFISRSELEFSGNILPDIGSVMYDSNTIIGYIAGYYTFANNFNISILLIEPGYRNNGLGKALLYHFIKHLETLKINMLTSLCDYDNHDAIRLYENLGISMRPCFELVSSLKDIKETLYKNILKEEK